MTPKKYPITNSGIPRAGDELHQGCVLTGHPKHTKQIYFENHQHDIMH